MGEEAVIAVLAVVGLLSELGGLALVVWGIRRNRGAAREASEGAPGSDLTLAVGMSLSMPFKVHGREPTPEERLKRVEQTVAGLVEREHKVRDELQDYVNQKLSHVERGGVARDESLRRFLSELLEGDLRQQLWGVGLFTLGAILSTASSVWDALAA